MDDARDFDLGRAIAVIRRKRRGILLAAGVSTVLAAVLTLFTEPVYRATTRIEVNKSALRSPISGQTIESDTWHSDDITLFTAAELVTNREMLADVVRELESQGAIANESPSAWRRWLGGRLERLASRLGIAGEAEARPAEPGVAPSRGPEWLLGILHVKPVKDTRLVRIQVDHPDRALARRVADAVARKFIEIQSLDNASSDSERSTEMRRRIAQLQSSISARESLLYADERDPIVLQGELDRVGGTLGALNDAQARTQTERLALEARIGEMRRLAADSALSADGGSVQSPAIETLRGELRACRSEIAQAQTVYRARHPHLLALASKEQGLSADLRREFDTALRGLQDDRAVLVARERSLSEAIAAGETHRRAIGDRTHRNAMLEGELKNDVETLGLLQSRLQDAELSGQIREPAARVVEPARIEPQPVRPRPVLNAGVGLLLGLLGGTGAAFLGEALKRTIRTPEDATRSLQLPILAVIPHRS